MKPLLGLLIIGHPDYPHDLGAALADQAATALGAAGVEILPVGPPVTDPLAAAEAARTLLAQQPEGIIFWLATWLECSTALAAWREVEHLPLAVWGFPMFEHEGQRESTGSLVAALTLKGALERMDYHFRLLVGLPSDPATLAAAHDFCAAAHAAGQLKRTRLGLVGYSAMAIYPGTFDHALLRRIIGPEVVHLDTYTLVREAERVTPEAAAAVARRLQAGATLAADPARLLKASALGAALETLVQRHHLNAINVKCQYELSQEYGMTACLPTALLADSGIVAGCEGDVLTTVSQAMLAGVSGQVTTYADVLDLQGRQVLLSSCGYAPLSLAAADPPPRLCELDYPGFDGLICSLLLRPELVTYARLSEGRGDYRLHFGTARGLPSELRQGRFPALTVELDGCPEAFVQALGSQHLALCYGDQTAALTELCRILGITAIRT
jgi:L-fucose isomerase-like protein